MTIPFTRKVLDRVIQLLGSKVPVESIFMQVTQEFSSDTSPFEPFLFDEAAFDYVDKRGAYLLGLLAARLTVRGNNSFSIKSPLKDQRAIEDLINYINANKGINYTSERFVRVIYSFSSEAFHNMLERVKFYEFRAGTSRMEIPDEVYPTFYQGLLMHGGKIQTFRNSSGKQFNLTIFSNIGFTEDSFKLILTDLADLINQDEITSYKMSFSDKTNKPKVEIDGSDAIDIVREVFTDPYSKLPEHIAAHIPDLDEMVV